MWIPVSVETAQNRLHEMGFDVLTGIFIDGHEWPEVVASRVEFFHQMVKLDFLHFTNAPTEGAQKVFPDDLLLTGDQKHFHDERTFQS